MSLTYRVLAPDGSERKHALRARASADGLGQTRVLGVLEDLSGRARTLGISSVEAAPRADVTPVVPAPRLFRNVPRAVTGEHALHAQRASLVLPEQGHQGEGGERNEVGLIGSAAQGDD